MLYCFNNTLSIRKTSGLAPVYISSLPVLPPLTLLSIARWQNTWLKDELSKMKAEKAASNDKGSPGGSEESYQIAGKSMTISQIRDLAPIDRTIAHWAVLVDWDLHRQRPYVVVDPYDPEGLLYLSRSEYLSTVKVCASNDMSVMVVARPGSTRPKPISQNSPHHDGSPFDSYEFYNTKALRLTWRDFMRMRKFVSRNVKVEDGMVTESAETLVRTTLLWARQLLHYNGVTSPERRLQGINPFAQSLASTARHNGITYASKRLKIMLFSVYSYLSGHPLTTTESLGIRVRLTSGLPVVIPRPFRDLIRSRDLKWIRIWVSIINIYRSLGVKTPDPDTAYSTIQKPRPNLSEEPLFERWKYFCKEVWPQLVADKAPKGKVPLYEYKSNFGLLVRSAGANLRGSASILSLILDAKAWKGETRNLPMEWFKLHKDEGMALWMSKISEECHWCKLDPNKVAIWEKDPKNSFIPDMETLLDEPWNGPIDPKSTKREREARILELRSRRKVIFDRARVDGALVGFARDAIRPSREALSYRDAAFTTQGGKGSPDKIEELAELYHRYGDTAWITGRLFNFDAPGGKLRTVAICDYWTQVAMRSVHDHLFKLLKLFGKNDATFDQQGIVDAYFQQRFQRHWSFDLSAATDSIPLDLYKECLTPLFKMKGEAYDDARKRVELWASLMTDRDFHIPTPKKGEAHYTGQAMSRTVRYSTGQPMGAYSSWASMALVHHCIVQFASWLVNQPLPNISLDPDTREPREMPCWFDTYLVLGDDVDIAESDITADNYQLVCAAFHIKIGLAKSLRSRENFFEFANQRFCKDGNISPLSFSEELTSSESWNRRVEYVQRISSRFGIVLNELNLVKLVLTSRQWTSLIPEFSGFRPKVFLRLLRFILLNPLKPNWHSDMVISIEAVLEWISQLKELVKSTASAELWSYLELQLTDQVMQLVKSDVARRMDSIPPFRSPFSAYSETEQAYKLVKCQRMFNWQDAPPRGAKYVRPLAPTAMFAVSYIQASVNIFNEQIRKQLNEFKNANWKYLTPPKIHTQPIPEPRNIPGEVYDPAQDNNPENAISLEAAVKMYIDLGNVPNPIAMDSDQFAACLRTEPSARAQVEHAEVLLKVILPLVAEYLGHRVAGIPYYPLKGASGGNWYRLMKRSLQLFQITKSEVDSNPGLSPGLLNYIRSKMYRVPSQSSTGRAQIVAATLVAQSGCSVDNAESITQRERDSSS